ncbi:hypothetical protein ILUMI_17690 [Ignelater luminosus]|uniref:Uncharacterized protein n=1 Tax=Ignelater luminosus TaxID=2038154 RepID=A0A8K0CQ05_IGNLU|nr:hypothetical protein ILUMI_17690 [Ignelater luminosus]
MMSRRSTMILELLNPVACDINTNNTNEANSTETSPAPSVSSILREILSYIVEDTCRDGFEMDYEVFDDSDADPDSNVEDEVGEIPNNNLETDNLDNETMTVVHRRGRRPRKNKTREIRNDRKRKRNMGLEYVTKGEKVVKPRLAKALS